jgi:hypothetical protein
VVAFSCFKRLNSVLAVPRPSNLVSGLSLPDMFSAVPRVSGPVFMFCACLPLKIFKDEAAGQLRVNINYQQ